MEPSPVAVAFVRHAGEIFLRRHQAEDGETEQWSVPFGDEGANPEEMAAAALDRDSLLDRSDAHCRRVGTPIDFEKFDEFGQIEVVRNTSGSPTVDAPVRIYPVLFDYEKQVVTEDSSFEWVSPPVLLDRYSPWPLWEAYDRIRPTVETIRSDTEHGSTELSVRALEVLRDEAALLSVGGNESLSIEKVAHELATARPSMTAVANRIGRAIASPEGVRTPSQVETTAQEEIDRAIEADRNAAAFAGERIEGMRVATLSRSGTVLQALNMAEPSAVLVSESRPGGEGVTTACQVSEVAETTVTSDAAFPTQLGEWNADALLVGADSVLADGAVVNKVGTYGAALAANDHDIEVIVVTSSDKISPGTSFNPEPRDGCTMVECAEGVAVANPTFEATPRSRIDAVVTEQGVLGEETVREIAREHAARLQLFDETADEHDA